jgi:NADH-quinone oxidoreductase subunit H
VGVVVSIPFLTLFERKILSYIQFRKGPKKVRINGLLQPISDGAKLVFKETVVPIRRKKIIYFFSPLFRFFLMLVV